MRTALIVALFALLFVCGVWYELSLWSECRRDHSWFYCQRVLEK